MARELARGNFFVVDSPAMRKIHKDVPWFLRSLDEAAASVNDAVRVDTSNIAARFVQNGVLGKLPALTTIEGARPPWPLVWIESYLDNMQIIGAGGNIIGSASRIGALITEVTEYEKDNGGGNLEHIVTDPNEITFQVYLWTWPSTASNPQGPIVQAFITLDESGRVMTDAEGVPRVLMNDLTKGAWESYHGAKSERDFPRMFAFFAIHFPLEVFRFANCRNVEMIEVLPNRQQRRYAERHGDATIRHSVLTVSDKLTQRRVGQRMEHGAELQRRMHICRGHYSTYTDAAPLFGKHVGRFWIPAHVRGNRGVGEVHKDYQFIAEGA